MWDFLAIFLVFVTLYWFLVFVRHPPGFPPGPRFALPLVGCATAVGFKFSKGFQSLREEYGDIFGLWLNSRRAVVVSSYDLIQEVGAKDEFSDRRYSELAAETRGGSVRGSLPGVLFSKGQTWIEQRRYTLHTLRNLGFGKNNVGEKVNDEVNKLIRKLEALNGQPVDVRNEFNISVLNALWTILTGEELGDDDPKIVSTVRLLDQTLQQGNATLVSVVASSPFLRKINEMLEVFAFGEAFGKILQIAKTIVKEHEETYQEDSMRDFVDNYIKEIKKRNAFPDDSTFKGKEGRLNLVNIVVDLFMAGSETTSTTLNWAVLFMILNPDVQSKVQDELDKVTGTSRPLYYRERSSTPYTEAVIHEVQRLANILSLSVPHFAGVDGTLDHGRYFIPKGTILFCNIGAVLSDPNEFPNPSKFDPTRFLTPEGQFKSHPKVIPFGLGKRRCLGETLAREELYLFFTGLLSTFTIEKGDKDAQLSTKPIYGFTLSPQTYTVKFIARK